MKDMKRDYEQKKLLEERTTFTRKCSCGHSIVVYPTMKKEYMVCGWCHKKVFKDLEKQKEQDRKIEREDFRMKMWNALCTQ